MLLHIVARGRIGRSPEAELVDRYAKRIAWPMRVTELPDTGGREPATVPHSRRILLDEKGEMLGSMAFAEKLGRWRDDGVREARFLIGAADGFDDAARQEADLLVIGGYGHGRLREMVLGGVTRHLLRHAPLPVLLSH